MVISSWELKWKRGWIIIVPLCLSLLFCFPTVSTSSHDYVGAVMPFIEPSAWLSVTETLSEVDYKKLMLLSWTFQIANIQFFLPTNISISNVPTYNISKCNSKSLILIIIIITKIKLILNNIVSNIILI